MVIYLGRHADGERDRSKTTFNELWVLENTEKHSKMKTTHEGIITLYSVNSWQTGKGERWDKEPTIPLSSGTISFGR